MYLLIRYVFFMMYIIMCVFEYLMYVYYNL